MREVLDAAGLAACVRGLADSLLAAPDIDESLVLVGIRRRGVPLAEQLAEHLSTKWRRRPEIGSLDIAFYRDDLSLVAPQPLIGVTDIPISLDDRPVCLIDDVLFTGRTTRAALEAVMEFGRPAWIRLAVLIDRGHRELPIQADYVGWKLDTRKEDDVRVMVRPIDERDGVFITQPERTP